MPACEAHDADKGNDISHVLCKRYLYRAYRWLMPRENDVTTSNALSPRDMKSGFDFMNAHFGMIDD